MLTGMPAGTGLPLLSLTTTVMKVLLKIARVGSMAEGTDACKEDAAGIIWTLGRELEPLEVLFVEDVQP